MANDNMPIEVTTTGSYRYYKEFLSYTLFKGRFFKVKPIILTLLLFAAIILYLIRGFDIGFDSNDFYFIGTFFIILISIIYIVFIYPQNHYKQVRTIIEGRAQYRFDEDSFSTQAVTDMTSGSGRIEYDAITKVINLDDILILQLFTKQAFVIYKDTCSPEDIGRIIELLKRKNRKYYNYGKRTK